MDLFWLSREKNLKAYVRMAKMGKEMWMKHGALDYKECVGDDLETKWGKPFSKMMKLKPGETVVFSWVVFKSRAHRDRVNAKVMKEMEEKMGDMDMKDMPIDVEADGLRRIQGNSRSVAPQEADRHRSGPCFWQQGGLFRSCPTSSYY